MPCQRLLHTASKSVRASCLAAARHGAGVGHGMRGMVEEGTTLELVPPEMRHLTPCWVFLGMPGVGKGTYAARVAELFRIPHISASKLLQAEVARGTDLGLQVSEAVVEGRLLPDSLMTALVRDRVRGGRRAGERGFVLDGFPRTVGQAMSLDGLLDTVLDTAGGILGATVCPTGIRPRGVVHAGSTSHVSVHDSDSVRAPSAAPGSDNAGFLSGDAGRVPAGVILDITSSVPNGLEAAGQFTMNKLSLPISEGVSRPAASALTDVEWDTSWGAVSLVVNLQLPEEVLVRKCMGRRTCSVCGEGFNLAAIDEERPWGGGRVVMPAVMPPGECIGNMVRREDDAEEVVLARLKVYKEESEPVEEYYRPRGILVDFDACGGITATWRRLIATLLQHELKHRAKTP